MLLKPVTSWTALLKRNQDLAQAYDSSPCMSPAHWSADMDPVPGITAQMIMASPLKTCSLPHQARRCMPPAEESGQWRCKLCLVSLRQLHGHDDGMCLGVTAEVSITDLGCTLHSPAIRYDASFSTACLAPEHMNGLLGQSADSPIPATFPQGVPHHNVCSMILWPAKARMMHFVIKWARVSKSPL